MDANRPVLKSIWQSNAKNAQIKGSKELDILKGNLMLLQDHPKGCNKIQDHYKDQKFILVHPQQTLMCITLSQLMKKDWCSQWTNVNFMICDIPSRKMIPLKILKRRMKPRCPHTILR